MDFCLLRGDILRIRFPLGFLFCLILVILLALFLKDSFILGGSFRIGLGALFQFRVSFLPVFSAPAPSLSLPLKFPGIDLGPEFFLCLNRSRREIMADEIEVDINLLLAIWFSAISFVG